MGSPVQLAAADSIGNGTIIVTGARQKGLKVEDGAASVQVLDADTLSHVGQANLNQALTQIVPSFVAESFDGDTGNLTLAARLRGLSPNETRAARLGLKDVVKITVFLVGDPKNGGKLDFKGFSEVYGQFFGTADQPNKVARSVVQASALANPGFLVEIEATAAK